MRDGMNIGAMSFEVQGEKLSEGSAAPSFSLTANNWRRRSLNDFEGKVKIISVVPSLDTSVCSAQTRRFNEAAAGLSESVVVLTVSADLPYAQARWCAAEGIERVETLSDHKDMNFASAYGVHVVPLRITQRAVFVVDQHDVIRYAQYMQDIGSEVDFDAALAKARECVSAEPKGE